MAEDQKKKRLYGEETDDALSQLYGELSDGSDFSYDLDGDALYRQYKDRYTQNARLAMQDAMGQAAALTGGYGSSYAQGVGQQRYDETMRALTDRVSALEQSAYSRWKDRRAALKERYELLRSRAAAEQDAQGTAYSRLYALIGATGYEPGDEELAAAGMSRRAAEALRSEYLRKTGRG